MSEATFLGLGYNKQQGGHDHEEYTESFENFSLGHFFEHAFFHEFWRNCLGRGMGMP
jgi:hypothetical protein